MEKESDGYVTAPSSSLKYMPKSYTPTFLLYHEQKQDRHDIYLSSRPWQYVYLKLQKQKRQSSMPIE